jgi:hypothetical protein
MVTASGARSSLNLGLGSRVRSYQDVFVEGIEKQLMGSSDVLLMMREHDKSSAWILGGVTIVKEERALVVL